MKKILLTKGYVTLIDDQDYDLLTQYKWSALVIKGVAYVVRYTTINRKNKTLYLHRILLGSPKGFLVDHANGDTLDNRRSNIRLCTAFQNHWNQKVSKNNKCGYKGVCYRRPSWVARIRYKGRTVHIGSFPTKEMAAKAYNATATRLFREFARLNIVPHVT